MKIKKAIASCIFILLVCSCNNESQKKDNKGEIDRDADITKSESYIDKNENTNAQEVELTEIEDSNYCYLLKENEFYFTVTETGNVSGKLTLASENEEGIFTGEFRGNILLGTFKYQDEQKQRKVKEMAFLKNDSDHSLKQGIGELKEIDQKMRFVDLERIKYDGLKLNEVDCEQLTSFRGY